MCIRDRYQVMGEIRHGLGAARLGVPRKYSHQMAGSCRRRHTDCSCGRGKHCTHQPRPGIRKVQMHESALASPHVPCAAGCAAKEKKGCPTGCQPVTGGVNLALTARDTHVGVANYSVDTHRSPIDTNGACSLHGGVEGDSCAVLGHLTRRRSQNDS